MPRRVHHVDDVLLHLLLHVDALHQAAQAGEVRRLQDRLHLLRGGGARHPAQDAQLLVAGGIVDPHLEHEAVHLRLRQRISALLLDRILGGEHHERVVERVAVVADGHLPLLHRLQQGALHLGRGAVDLVGKDDVGEDRSALGGELAAARMVHQRTDQIRRQQVGGELDAPEARADRLRQGGDGQRLGQARHALDQQVGVGDQPDQQPVEQPVLADDLLAQLAAYLREGASLALHLGRYLADVHVRCRPPCSGLPLQHSMFSSRARLPPQNRSRSAAAMNPACRST